MNQSDLMNPAAVRSMRNTALGSGPVSQPTPGSHAHLNSEIEVYLSTLDESAYDIHYVSGSEVSELFESDESQGAEGILSITWHDEAARLGLVSLIADFVQEHYSDYNLGIGEDGTFVFAEETSQDDLTAISQRLYADQVAADNSTLLPASSCGTVCSNLATCAYVICMATGGNSCSDVYDTVYYNCVNNW